MEEQESTQVTPERIMDVGERYRASAILGAPARHRLFTHIEEGARTAEAIAARAGISPRGVQALLDGLSGLGLVLRTAGDYENARTRRPKGSGQHPLRHARSRSVAARFVDAFSQIGCGTRRAHLSGAGTSSVLAPLS